MRRLYIIILCLCCCLTSLQAQNNETLFRDIYDQAEEDIALTTKKENSTRCLLGASNAIIIGRSSYTNLLVCYEGQCSNCLKQYGGTNYPLTWSSNGQQLLCARCNRSYDVNNGVVATGEGGHSLYNYCATFDGSILRAWN